MHELNFVGPSFLQISLYAEGPYYVNDRKLTSPFVGTFLYGTKSNFRPLCFHFRVEKLVIGNEKGVGLAFWTIWSTRIGGHFRASLSRALSRPPPKRRVWIDLGTAKALKKLVGRLNFYADSTQLLGKAFCYTLSMY